MENIITRKATPADTEQLLVLEQGIINAERPFDSTLKGDPLQYYNLGELIASPDSIVIVAEKDGQIIGSGYARVERTKHYHRHTHFAYLGFMYVLPGFRGQGINQRILEGLKSWTKEKGLTEMRLEVYIDNAAAIRAYEKFGFNSSLVEMRMPV